MFFAYEGLGHSDTILASWDCVLWHISAMRFCCSKGFLFRATYLKGCLLPLGLLRRVGRRHVGGCRRPRRHLSSQTNFRKTKPPAGLAPTPRHPDTPTCRGVMSGDVGGFPDTPTPRHLDMSGVSRPGGAGGRREAAVLDGAV